ncbi:MAG: hypothetical protein WAS51_05370 [Ilumatobacteraceae bacterium]
MPVGASVVPVSGPASAAPSSGSDEAVGGIPGFVPSGAKTIAIAMLSRSKRTSRKPVMYVRSDSGSL